MLNRFKIDKKRRIKNKSKLNNVLKLRFKKCNQQVISDQRQMNKESETYQLQSIYTSSNAKRQKTETVIRQWPLIVTLRRVVWTSKSYKMRRALAISLLRQRVVSRKFQMGHRLSVLIRFLMSKRRTEDLSNN